MINYLSETRLVVEPADKPGYYRLTMPWRFYALKRAFLVPQGFVFDGDSVPRIPLIYALFKGRSGMHAPCAHDYLYKTGQTSRKDADAVYWAAMRHHGISKVWAIPHYLGVRLGGWRGWRRYRESED